MKIDGLFNKSYPFVEQAPIAQLDRALPSEGRGQTFESSWVHHVARERRVRPLFCDGVPGW